jgi:hypothetical protein
LGAIHPENSRPLGATARPFHAEEATVAVVSVVAARAEAATEAVRAVAASAAASVAERAAVALWVETLAPRLSAQIHRRQ